jgi:hypothetical protein
MREPGIHNHDLGVWIPGSLATLGPRNDDRENDTDRQNAYQSTWYI